MTPTEGWLVPFTLASSGIAIVAIYIVMVWATGQMQFGWIFPLCFAGLASLTVSERWNRHEICFLILTDPLLVKMQVAIALTLSHFVCLYLWTRDFDPDIYCLPYVSSIIDVLGQLMLVVAFWLATSLGDHVSVVVGGEHTP